MGFEAPVRPVLERRRPYAALAIVIVAFASAALLAWRPWQSSRQPAAAVGTSLGGPVGSAGPAGELAVPATSGASQERFGTTPSVLVEGILAVPQTSEFDLDAGRLADRGRAGLGHPNDIWFEVVTDSERYLVPLGGGIAVLGTNATGYAACLAALARPTQTYGGSLDRYRQPPRAGFISLSTLTSESHVCVRTDEGRLAEFWFENPVDSFPMTLVIRYRTWAT